MATQIHSKRAGAKLTTPLTFQTGFVCVCVYMRAYARIRVNMLVYARICVFIQDGPTAKKVTPVAVDIDMADHNHRHGDIPLGKVF